MTGIVLPSDPAPDGYVPNPYTAEIDAALAYLHTEKDSEDGWELIDTKDGIVMEKKFVPGDNSAIPIVRGRGLVKSISPAMLLSTIRQPSARSHWDSRFASGGILERYGRRTYKFYSVQKGLSFLVSERDIVGVQHIVCPQGEVEKGFEVVQTSVLGDSDNPGRVRATLTCAGWSVVPRGPDLEVSYVIKINPNGSIPSGIAAKLVQDIPMSIVNIAGFIRSSGWPPYISSSSISSQLRTETFSLENRSHKIKFIAGSQEEEITVAVDPKPFGGDWKVEVFGNGVSVEKKDNNTAVIFVSAGSGKFELNIVAA
ncbi:start domain-containing protein [Ceratobasidium sp. AG-Ba]|nr:start domain-containing protein [Ceratobasidium sp. AG-Ba]